MRPESDDRDAATADRVAIAELVARYAALVDDRELDAASLLFTEDAVLLTPDPPQRLDPVLEARGRPAIRAALAAVASVPATVHNVFGVVVDFPEQQLEGAVQALGRVGCEAHHFGAERDLVWHIVYRDNYRLGAEGWRIARRELGIRAIEVRTPRQVNLGR